MGCTLSIRDPHGASPTVFKVFNVDDSGQDRNPGKLEVTEQALMLHQKGKEPIGWPLRGLRRYGFDADLFSFESGRRCPTGPGIYAFRCQRAEALFNLLQEYITQAGHGDDHRRVDGPQEPFDSTVIRPEMVRANFMHIQSPVRQNGRIPLSEYRNVRTVTDSQHHHHQESASPRLTLARLPDILAMSHRQTVDPVIHYADLQLSVRPGDDDQDVFADDDVNDMAMVATATTGPPRSLSDRTSSSNHTCYVNVSAENRGGGGGKVSEDGGMVHLLNGRSIWHSESIPFHSYSNVDVVPSSSSAPLTGVNYIQLDLERDNVDGQSALGSPISPASFHMESPLAQRDSYTTIDFDRTRALNAITIDNSGEEGLRKTRHNSNIEMLSST